MEINAKDDLKLVEIWVTNDEQQSEGFEKKLEGICEENKAAGCKTVVFRSGNKNLYDCTEGLVLNNYQL